MGRAGLYGPARPSWNLGPVMLNFISISIFKRFFNENLNFINNSFKIKYCSFKKMADIGKIFAEYSQKTARPAEILGLNGPTQLKFRPHRPGPVHSNFRAGTARPDLSSLGFTTLYLKYNISIDTIKRGSSQMILRVEILWRNCLIKALQSFSQF